MERIVNRKINQKNIEILLTSVLILSCSYILYRYLPNSKLILVGSPFLLILNLLRLFIEDKIKKFLDLIIRYRWFIGLILFTILVIFRIHGSSIGAYNQVFGSDTADTSEIFGKARLLRGDEFNVQIAYYFSQFYNGFKEISNQMSIAGQDMIIGYNAPVIDLTLIGKPFIWGYILFGNEIGLSWYWCMKTILCILVCYEMFNILVRNKYVSFFGSFLLVFSPMMQWWFSPHMYDVFFWAMSLFVVGYYFFMAQSIKTKWFFTIISSCSLVGFVIALFPSLQIPSGLLMLALLIGCIIRDKSDLKFNKKDCVRVGTVILIVSIVLGHFILTASDEIKLLYSTVYPGKRVSVGGDQGINSLFTNFSNLFSPYKTPAISNECETSTFNHLGVLCIFLFPYVVYINKKNKIGKKLNAGYILFCTLLIEIFFMLVGFPEWLAKITLFSYINRMNIVYGFTATIFSVYVLYLIYDINIYCNKVYLLLSVILYGILNLLSLNGMMDTIYVERFTSKIYYLLSIGFIVVSVFFVFKYNRFALSIVCAWIVLTGCTINPIVSGISAIENHSFVKAAINQSKKSDGYWLTTNSTLTQELLMANGLKVVNGVNFYPDYGKWELIDGNQAYDDIYNRYAHMIFNIVSNEESFNANLIYPDCINVNININDLRKWNVHFICSTVDYSNVFIESNVEYNEFYNENGIILYELNY